MAPPNNPMVAKVSLVGNRDTREWVNTFHVAKSSNYVQADLLPLAQLFYNWWHTNYRLAVSPDCFLNQIQVRVLNPALPLALDYSTGLPEAGAYVPGSGDTIEPGNVTAAMSLRTGLAGRSQRGRFYVPSWHKDQVTSDDRMNSSWVTTYVSILAQLLATFLTQPYQLAIFHKATNLFTLVTSFVVDAVLDSQRRRLPGRGR